MSLTDQLYGRLLTEAVLFFKRFSNDLAQIPKSRNKLFNVQMIDLANEGNEKVIQLLIEHGADVRVHI